MPPHQPQQRRTAPAQLHPPRQRRPPLSPRPQWQNLFLAPRYSDPSIQQEIDEEYDEGATPRRTYRR
jgi:hypothetical protein